MELVFEFICGRGWGAAAEGEMGTENENKSIAHLAKPLLQLNPTLVSLQ